MLRHLFSKVIPICASSLIFSGALAAEVARNAYQLPVMTFAKDAGGYYVNVSDEAYLRYMWDSFVALNWPAEAGSRGEPDTAATRPASRYPVVWETLAKPQEVFLPESEWANYPVWNKLSRLPAGLSLEQARDLCQGFSADDDIILYDINQPNVSIRSGPVAPLMDQHRRYVRYQVAMNRPFFEYIRANHYYDADRQVAAVRVSEQARFEGGQKTPRGAFVALPFDTDDQPGMLEIKSAWRVLDPEFDEPARYYSRPGFILSPDRTRCERAPAGLGLVALHIHRLTRLSHAAATFEQIDNVAILDPEGSKGVQPSFNPGTGNDTQSNLWPPYGNRGFSGALPPLITADSSLPPRERRQPNNVSRATPIPEKVREVNREYRARHADTPLQYYHLINAQHVRADCRMRETGDFSQPREWLPVTCPRPNTRTLINAALESYTQLVNPFTGQPYNYSCQDCHSHARPCGFSGPVTPELTLLPEFVVMSYLLSKAKFPGQRTTPDGYSCNNPATRPPVDAGGDRGHSITTGTYAE